MKVLDQFEVEPNVAYSGSYVDLIFTGSFSSGNRKVMGSKASGSNEYKASENYSDFQSLTGAYRNRNLGAGFRFQHHISPVERFQDTILPDVFSAYTLNGGKAILANPEYGISPVLQTGDDAPVGDVVVGKIVLTTFGTTASYGDKVAVSSDGTQAGDGTWIGSSPFQGRYRNVVKQTKFSFYRAGLFCPVSESLDFTSRNITRYGGYPGSVSSSLVTVEVIIPLLGIPFAEPTPGRGGTEPVRFTLIDVTGSVSATDTFKNGFFTYPPSSTGAYGVGKGTKRPGDKQLTKLLFGFGDNYQGVPILTGVTSSYLNDTVGVVNGYYPSAVEIRGWKYGVFSGYPQYSTCVFRSQRYGQFRDLLEQRRFTKFYDPDGFTSDGKNNGPRGPKEAVVLINFVSGSDAQVSASAPDTYNPNDSGMYDFEYKSGQPFHDL